MGRQQKGEAQGQSCVIDPFPIITVYLVADPNRDYQVRLAACTLPAEGYGIILHGIARQVAMMFAKEGNYTEQEVLERICEWFNKESERPTSEMTQDKLH